MYQVCVMINNASRWRGRFEPMAIHDRAALCLQSPRLRSHRTRWNGSGSPPRWRDPPSSMIIVIHITTLFVVFNFFVVVFTTIPTHRFIVSAFLQVKNDNDPTLTTRAASVDRTPTLGVRRCRAHWNLDQIMRTSPTQLPPLTAIRTSSHQSSTELPGDDLSRSENVVTAANDRSGVAEAVQSIFHRVETQTTTLAEGIHHARLLLENNRIEATSGEKDISVAAYATFLDWCASAATEGINGINATELEALVDDLSRDPLFFDRWTARDWTILYNTVLKAYKNESNPHSTSRAQKLLEQLAQRDLADTISYTTVVATLANRGDKSAALQAQQLLDQMMRDSHNQSRHNVVPNIQTFNCVIQAWVGCGEMTRAEQLLTQLEGRDGTRTTLPVPQNHDAPVAIAIAAPVSPTVVTYSTIMNGYARQQVEQGGGLSSVVRTFQRMRDAYEIDGNMAARPNLHSFVTLIYACKQHILNSSSETRPFNVSSEAPSAFVEDAAVTAENALRQLYNLYEIEQSQDLKPNVQLITAVIDCWQRSGRNDAGERAEALLNWTLELRSKHHDPDFEPNAYTFSSAITAWGKSRKFGKAVRARKVLDKMIELHNAGTLSTAPSTHCFTAVINSCAYCENDELEKRTALQIAVATFKELRSASQPFRVDGSSVIDCAATNEVSYSTLLTAIRNLSPDSLKRALVIRNIFESAVAEGLVSDLVVKRLQSSLSSVQINELLVSNDCDLSRILDGKGKIRLERIPTSWRRNVNDAFTRTQMNQRLPSPASPLAHFAR